MSGKRRSARLKGRGRPFDEGKQRFSRPVETEAGKFHLQHRRLGGERIRHRRDGGTDRTETVTLRIAGMTMSSISIGRRGSNQRASPGALAVGGVKVAKGQAEING